DVAQGILSEVEGCRPEGLRYETSRADAILNGDEEIGMKLSAGWVVGAGCAVSVGLVAVAILAPHVTAFQAGGTSTRAAQAPGVPDYITGVVQSSQGPEAGVWVIAETSDLPTGFIKIVVTDDRGRFALPQLPNATYRVWVRGYGLIDSTPVKMKPQRDAVMLRADVAKTPQEAAKVYPGDSMYGAAVNMGIPRTTKALADWTDRVANGEVPPAPPRPKGVERNVVLTLWDWGTDHSFMHDEISTAKNDPRVNAGGRVYAV